MELMQAPRGGPPRFGKRKWDVGPGVVPGATAGAFGGHCAGAYASSLPQAQAAAPAAASPAAALSASLAAAAAAAGAVPAALPGAPAPQGPSAYTAPQAAAGPLDRFVRLRGLPFSAGEPEVRAFLGGLGVEAVRFCIAPNGRTTGEAVVALPSLEAAAAALQRDRTYLGHRYVEVYASTADEFLRTPGQAQQVYASTADEFLRTPGQAQQAPMAAAAAGGASAVLRMRGLPFSASTQEIARFWAGFALVRAAQVPLGPDGRPSGEAYVEFASLEEAGRALAQRQRSLLGNRYVELYPSTYEEMCARAGEGRPIQVPPAEQPPPGRAPPRPAYGPAAGHGQGAAGEVAPTGVVRMRGLPYQATAGDILRFFQGFGLTRIMPTAAPQHGRPSGEAYVEFVSAAEGSRAAHQKQRGLLGQRYIELFHADPQEMASQAALGQGIVDVCRDGSLRESRGGGGPPPRPAAPQRGSRPQPPAPRPEGDPGVVLLMRGLPYQATVEDIVSFFAGCGVARVLPTGTLPGGRPSGEAYVEFASAAECDATLSSHQHQHIGSRYIELFPVALSEMKAAEDALQASEVGPDGAASEPAGGFSQQQGAPSPVLMMRGLPFQATTDDISTFFSGFSLVKIVAVMPEEGRPNKGDAYVELTSAEECSRALQDCQHKYVGNRYIQLFPATVEEMRRAAARAAEAYSESPTYAPPPSHNGESGPVLRMRGLPFEATAEAIAHFFDGFKPVTILPSTASYNGRPTGEGYVEFATMQDAEEARAARHKAMMGSRWIELYMASLEEFHKAAEGIELVDARTLGIGAAGRRPPPPPSSKGSGPERRLQ